MSPRTFFLALLALAVTGGLVVVAAPTAAAPPPVQLCAVCDGDLDGAADEGTLDIYVDADGDSTWIERIPVNESAADRYADDPEHLDAAVSEAWAGSFPHVAGDDVTGVSSEIEGETVVVTYAVADVANPGLGEHWVVDYFYAGDERAGMRYWIGGERVTLHPPDGHVVTNNPPDAAYSNGSVTWYAEDPAPLDSDFDRETLVVYGPDDSLAATMTTVGTLAVTIGPLLLVHAASGGFVPAFVLAVGATAAARIRPESRVLGGVHTRLLDLGRPGLGRIVAALGLVGAAFGFVLATVIPLRGTIALTIGAAGYALIGGTASYSSARPDPRWLFGGTLAVAASAAVVTWVVIRTPSALAPSALVLAAVAFFPLGYLTERDDCIKGPLLIIVVSPFVAVAAVAPVGPTPFTYGFLAIPEALFVLAVGYPLLVLGRLLDADPPSDD